MTEKRFKLTLISHVGGIVMTGLLGIDIWLSSDLSHTVLWFYCKPLYLCFYYAFYRR